MKQFIGFLCSITIFLTLFVGLFSVWATTAQAQSLPDPENELYFKYDKPGNKIIEYSARTNAVTGNEFSKPTGVDGDTVIIVPKSITTDEGVLSFQYNKNSKLYLLVRLKDSKTLGLYIKDSNGYHWDELFVENGKVKAHKGTVARPADVTGFSAEEIAYIGKMNGINDLGSAADGHGIYQVVNDFTPSQKITESTILCGKVKIDFTGSQYFDRLPADVKSKIQSGTWPSNFPGTPVMYLKYSNGYDAGGNWQGWANASFGSQNFRIPIQSDGTFKSENLRGLPIGKYKLVSVVYIRNDNPNDQNSVSRLDSPASGWWKDFVSDWTAVDKSIEQFITNKYEVEVKATGNSGSGFEGNGECVDLTYTYKGQIDPSSALSKSSGDSCDGQGSGISAMINEALCGLTVILKNAADKFFNWAVSWMEKSIGITRNESVDADDLDKITPPAKSPSGTPAGTTSTTPVVTTAPTASTGDITYSSPIVQSAEDFETAAINTCKAAQTDNVDLTKQPCLIKNLTYTKYGSSNSETIDTKSGIQIVKNGLSGMTDKFTKPNKCGVDTLIILNTNCEFSGTKGTPAGN